MPDPEVSHTWFKKPSGEHPVGTGKRFELAVDGCPTLTGILLGPTFLGAAASDMDICVLRADDDDPNRVVILRWSDILAVRELP